MTMKAGDTLHGFIITRVREVEELKGTLYELKHQKSGAQLMWLDNKEENRYFSVTFKTTPWDDTGVFHILEHSVLCGSKKYTVKEPFVELLKSSLKTFLNAMTFPDKTMYMVSSRNAVDYQNLVEVYLDAVFAPAIYDQKNIFYQEGWHYELHQEQELPAYKGVVFNEMKGAFSSVDTLLSHELRKQLFTDNCYGFESGGEPQYITDLTYEQFLEAHRVYYNPGNARFYLDGDINLPQILALMDEQYLGKCTCNVKPLEIPMQEETPAKESICYYEISPEDTEEANTQMMMGQIIGSWQERRKVIAVQILGEYLCGSNEAPLLEAVLNSGLAQDITMNVYDGIAQPFLCIQLQNMNYEDRQDIREVMTSTLEAVFAEGLDVQELSAIINQYEFQMRQGQEPMAMGRGMNAMHSWLYGGDPLEYMTWNEIFTQLREGVNDGYFTHIYQEIFLDDSHRKVVYALPSKTVGEEQRRHEMQKLQATCQLWNQDERRKQLAINEALDLWHQKVDTREDYATLPRLALSEVNPLPEKRETWVLEESGVTILYHPTATKGIQYLNLYYEVENIPDEQLPQLSLMAGLLGNLPTAHYSLRSLHQEIRSNIGMIHFDVKTYGKPGEVMSCGIYLVVSLSVLEEKLPKALELVTEIVLFSQWQQLDMVADVVCQSEQMFSQALIMDGHTYGMRHGASYFSAAGYVREQLEGYACGQWLNELVEELMGQDSSRLEAFAQFAAMTCATIFCQKRLTISITSAGETPSFETFIQGLPHGAAVTAFYTWLRQKEHQPIRENIQIPAGISYGVKGLNLFAMGENYSGRLRVLSQILSLGYLWPRVRVQGGAYGSGFVVSETGNAFYYSYRDPDAERSIEVYDQASEFLREFLNSDESLEPYIIGSIAELEPLCTPAEWAEECDYDYFCGITPGNRMKEKNDILHMTREELMAYCSLLDQIRDEGAVCIIGPDAPK